MDNFKPSLLAAYIAEARSHMTSKGTVAFGLLLSSSAAAVDNNIVSGASYTKISSEGNTHTIATKKLSGTAGINVFDDFVVGTSHTANLMVPTGADKLVNIVKSSSAPAVHGVLNSYQNGSLGGDIVFASSAGFLVGAGGIVNVGKLSIKTPTATGIANLVSGDDINTAALSDLLTNNFNVSSSGLVSIQGKVNAAGGLDIYSHSIDIDGRGIVMTGNTYGSEAVALTAVNVDDRTIPSKLQVSGGTIVLKAASTADDAISVTGNLYADGGMTFTADNISINDGAVIDTRNVDESGRGDVEFTAETTASGSTVNLNGSVHAGAVTVDASTSESSDGQASIGVNGDISASGSLAMSADDITVGDGSLTAAGIVKITADSSVDISGDLVSGKPPSLTDPSLIIESNSFTLGEGGSIDAAGNIQLTVDTQINVSGGIEADGGLTADSDSFKLDTGISVDVAGELSITAPVLVDVSGTLAAESGIKITSRDINLNEKSILDARNDLDTNRGDVILTAGAEKSVVLAEANVDTSIDFNGHVHAGNVTAEATSKAVSSYTENAGVPMTQMATGLFAGVSFYYMGADANATVNVNDTANIQASGNVTLASEAHAFADASALTVGNLVPAALASAYVNSDATSTTHVKSGATIVSNNLDVSAHNESYAEAVAYDVVASDTSKVVVSVAVGTSDVDATAKIDSGVALDTNSLVLAAENQNYYQVSATTMGIKATEYGLAVAVGDFDTKATAELGSSLGSVGDVTITALDRTVNQRVHSGVTIGDSLLLRTIGSKFVSAFATMENYIQGALTKHLPTGTTAPPATAYFKGGAAVSLNLSEHKAHSYLGTNVDSQTDAPIVRSYGNVLVLSQTDLGTDDEPVAGGAGVGVLGGDQGGYRTSAEASIASSTSQRHDNALALAVNVAVNDSDAVAEVGNHVQIDAASLGVVAAQYMPIVSTYDKWDSFDDVTSKLNSQGGLENDILTAFANAGAAADKEAYGGAFSVVTNDMDTKAWIGDGAKINTTNKIPWNATRKLESRGGKDVFKDVDYNFSLADSVTVSAYNLLETVTVSGNLGSLGLILDANGTYKKGRSVGASINYTQQTGSAVSGIGKAVINAAGNVGIYADTQERQFVISPSSGMGEGLGINGTVSILNSEVLTHASLSNNAQLSALNLIVDADHAFGNWSAAGSVHWSDQSSVGISAAVNVSQGDTKAFIGDNKVEYHKVIFEDSQGSEITRPVPSAPSSPTPGKGTGAIIVNSVNVRSRSTGTNGSLAVAGTVNTSPPDEPIVYPVQKFENWYNSLSPKIASHYNAAVSGSDERSISQAAAQGNNAGNDAGDSAANIDSNNTGWTAAGSFTVSVNNLDAKAIIDGATISGRPVSSEDDETVTYKDVQIDVQAVEKVISASASGVGALSLLGGQSPSNQNTIAGAIAYQISFNDTLAWIKESVISHAGDVSVQALHGGELTSVGLSVAYTREDQTSGTTSNGALSISGAQIYDGTSARIQGSSISTNTGADSDLVVSAYNNSHIGAGGGTLFAGGKQGAGLAITFAEINDPSAMLSGINPDSNNILSTAYNEDVYNGAATEAIIDLVEVDNVTKRSSLNDFDNIVVSARSLNRIVVGAAGMGFGTSGDDAFGFQGSFAVGSIGADTHALVQGADISNAGAVSVNASGERDSDHESTLSKLGSSNVNQEFDFTGEEATTNVAVYMDDSGDIASHSYGSEGKRIITFAGVAQGSKKNVGISYSHADVKSETSSRIENTNINASKDDAGADIDVNARDNSLLYSFAAGLGVGTGGLSGVGSVAVNRLNNQVLAEIGDWDGADQGIIKASDLTVKARNDMDVVNGAGALAVSQSTISGGLAVALNLIGSSGEHSTIARVSNAAVCAEDDFIVKASSGSAGDRNILVGNAIGIGWSQSKSPGFAGAIGINNVDQNIEAQIKDTNSSSMYPASANSGDIVVDAQDHTDSVATAWTVAGSSQGSGAGVAVGVNRVDSDVTAEILGDNAAKGSTNLKARDISVNAARDNRLLTINAGVAASNQLSLAGSVGTGVIDGDVTARIAEKAVANAWNNILVNADARSVNEVGSGAIGFGVDMGAGVLAVSTALEYGETKAYIDQASVQAYGRGNTMLVDTGDLANYGTLPDLSTAGPGDDDGDDVNTDPVTMDDLTTGFDLIAQDKVEEAVNGLVVNATSRTKQRAITVGGTGGNEFAITANAATNHSHGTTSASIQNTYVNGNVGDNYTGADVLVRANSHEAGLAVSAGVAAAGGDSGSLAAVAGFATNAQKRRSDAMIGDNPIFKADVLTIDANSSKLAQGVAAGGAAAGAKLGAGVAGSVVITEQAGDTRAWLRGGSVIANEVLVTADRRQEANVAAGAAGFGTALGAGAGLAVNIVGGDSVALIGNDLDDDSDNDVTLVQADKVTVDADRLSSVQSHTFGLGGGVLYAGAAMIDTTEFRGETRAAIHGKLQNNALTTSIRNKDGASAATNVTVNAQEIQSADQWAIGAAIGGKLGLGAVANVVLGRSQVYGEVVGADVKAGTLNVDAVGRRQSDLTSVAVGASAGGAGAASIGVALYGQGDTTTEDGTNAEDEFDPSRQEVNTILATDVAGYNRHLSDEDIAVLAADSGSTIARSGVPATSTATESGHSLTIEGESVTAARISGGTIDVDTLNVNSRTQQHSHQSLGAVIAGAAGLSGVVGISRSYEMSIATVDSDVLADDVSVGARVENVSDDDAALEMKSFTVGATGGTTLTVNYTDARSANRVVAGVHSAVGADDGKLQVSAQDLTDIRLGDTDAGKPSADTDGSLNLTLAAGGAVGVSVGYAEKDSDVDAWVGETGKLVSGYDAIDITARNAGMVKSTAFALAGGLFGSAQGVITGAHDDSKVNATVYGTIDTGTRNDSTVNVLAQSAPELYSSAYGVQVSSGASIGGSFAYATTDTVAQAEIADGTLFDGRGDVIIRSQTGRDDDDYETARARAVSASGGLLVGAAGSEARATNEAQSVAKVGDYVALPDGNLEVYAKNRGVQLADAHGYSGGVLSGGYQTGLAQSYTSTRVEFGRNPMATLGRRGDLILDAGSVNENQSYTIAGAGGMFTGNGADSLAEAGNHKNGKASAAVIVEDWDSGYRQNPIEAGGVTMSAASETHYFAGTDSTAFSLAGGSNARALVDVDTQAQIDLGENVSLSALNIDIDAVNAAYQIRNPYFMDDTFSVASLGGGGASASFAKADQSIDGLAADVVVGKNAVLRISDMAWLDSTYGHDITLDATTDFYAANEARMEVGGLYQGGQTASSVSFTTFNTVTLEEGVQLDNPVDEIGIGTLAKGDASSEVNAKIYGSAGIGGGSSSVTVNSLNQVAIGGQVDINAFGDIGIYAGRASDGFQENRLSGRAETHLYNWTALPIPSGKKASADIVLNNQLAFGASMNIGSDSHVSIQTNEGDISATHYGVEKNPWMEAFSTENRFGSSDASVANTLTFAENGTVEAGQNAYQSVTIDSQGVIDSRLARYGTAAQLAEQYSSRDELQANLDALEQQRQQLINHGGAEADIASLDAEIRLLGAIRDRLTDGTNTAVRVADGIAGAGNVYLAADSIAVGDGTLFTAKGDAYITIDNQSDEHLLLDNITIANRLGGNVLISGGAELADSHISEQSGLDFIEKAGINVIHSPQGPNAKNADVVIKGDLTNLQSGINIDLIEGDLVQLGTIRANAIDLNVLNGSLVVDHTGSYYAYGRDPVALTNYTGNSNVGWKPSSPDEFVHLYINSRYSEAIEAKGISHFNNWFSGWSIHNFDKAGAQIDYYKNAGQSKRDDYGYDELNVYFNWGFHNDREYEGDDAIVFTMKKYSESRGGRYWLFQPVYDKQDMLKQTASYSEVESVLGDPGSSIIAGSVFINAERLDLNGAITVGQEHNWSVDVGTGFDAQIAEYIQAKGLVAGDRVTITPGDAKAIEGSQKTYDFDISASEGTEGIGLVYDVASGKLLANDVKANSGGYVDIRARISSTGEDGRITVNDGRGRVSINNDSQTQLVLGDISPGGDSEGIIRITDLNKTKNVLREGEATHTFSEWFVHRPGEKVHKYVTVADATTYESEDFIQELGDTGLISSTSYAPESGQLYYIRENAEVARTFNKPASGYFGSYSNVFGDWQYQKDWNVEESYYTTCASKPEACAGSSASNYLTHSYTAEGITESAPVWNLSYRSYYGDGLVDTDPAVHMPYYLSMDAHTYVKADNPIQLEFIGQSAGVVDIDSQSGLELTGNVYNPGGITTIATQGAVAAAEQASVTADVLTMSAVNDIGSSSQALALVTDDLGLTSTTGSLYFTATGVDGDIALQHLTADGDIVGVFDTGITAKDGNTLIQSGGLNLTSLTGDIGKVGGEAINIKVTGPVRLSAAGDIAITQKSGDLLLDQVSARGDVKLIGDNGHIRSASQVDAKTDEQLAADAAVWDNLNLLGEDAGQVSVTAYENEFTNNYHTYWLLKQRIADTSDDNFQVSPEFAVALFGRYGAGSMAELTQLVKAEYQGLEQWFTDQVASQDNQAGTVSGALQGYDYGNLLTGAYDADYRMSIATDSSWYNTMVEGARWNQSQLDISISSAVLSGDAANQLTNREPNVVAANLSMGTFYNIGESLTDLTINLSRDGSASLTDAEKSALLAAGAGDITTQITDDTVSLQVRRVNPLTLQAEGELNAVASNMYLESVSDITLGELNSTGGDIRLVADGAIAAKSGVTNITARNAYLANTRNAIGSFSNPVVMALYGGLDQAVSGSDMYLSLTDTGALPVDLGVIRAGGMLSIDSKTDLRASSDNSLISATGFDLNMQDYDLGLSDQALQLVHTGSGVLNLTADNAWLTVQNTAPLQLNGINMGDSLELTAQGDLDIQGDITAGGSVKLDTQGALTSEGALKTTVGSIYALLAGSVDLENNSIVAGSATLRSRAGLTVSDITTTTGWLTLDAAGEMDIKGDVDVTGGIHLGAHRISMDTGTKMESKRSIFASVTDFMRLNQVSTDLRAYLTATNSQDSSLGDITITGLKALSGRVEAQNDISLSDVRSEGETLFLKAGGDVSLNKATVIRALDLEAEGDVALNAFQVGGDFDLEAQALSIGGGSSWAQSLKADVASVTMAKGAELVTSSDLSLTSAGIADLGRVASYDGVTTLTSGGTLTVSDTLKANSLNLVSEGDVQLSGSVDVTEGLIADIEGDMEALASVTVGQDLYLDAVGAIDFHDTLTSQSGLLDIKGGEHLRLHGAVKAAGSFNALTDDFIYVGRHVPMEFGGKTTLNAGGLFFMDGHSSLKSGGDLNITSRLSQTLWGTDVQGDMTLKSENKSIILAGAVDVAGTADIDAAYVKLSEQASGLTAADLSLTTQNDMELFAAVKSTGDAVLKSEKGDIRLQRGIEADGRIELTAQGNVTVDAAIETKQDLKVDANGELVVAGSVTAAKDITVDASAGASFQDTLTSTAGLLDVKGQYLGLHKTVDVGGDFYADLDKHLYIGKFMSVSSGGDTRVNTGGLVFVDTESTLSTGGDLHITTPLSQTLWATNVKGDMSLTSTGNSHIRLVRKVDVAGSADIQANRLEFRQSGALNTGALAITTTEDLTLGPVKATGDTRLESLQGGIILENDIDVDAHLLLIANGDLTFNQAADIDKELQLRATGDIAFNNDLKAATLNIEQGKNLDLYGNVSSGQFKVEVDGDVSLAAGKKLDGYFQAVDSHISASSLTMEEDSRLWSAGDLTLTTLGDQELADLVAFFNLRLDSTAGNITIKGEAQTAGTTVINAHDTLTLWNSPTWYMPIEPVLNAPVINQESGDPWVVNDQEGDSGQMSAVIEASGQEEAEFSSEALTINSSDIAIEEAWRNSWVWNGLWSQPLLEQTAGNVRAEVSEAEPLLSGVQGFLQAATGLGDSLVTDQPWLTAKTGSEDVHLLTTSRLRSHVLRATNGNPFMAAQEELDTEALLSAPWLLADGFLFTDQRALSPNSMRDTAALRV